MNSFYGSNSTVPRLQKHYEETVYFLQVSPEEFQVLILSTLERWKTKLTLEPPSGFELGTPGLEIQYLNP